MSEILNRSLSVAVLGSGAREHALALKIAESPFCEKVVVLPGNAGILLSEGTFLKSSQKQKIFCEPFDSQNIDGLIQKLHQLKIRLVVIGPDDLLAEGYTDFLEKEKFLVFGPTKAAAKLEWSKAYAKEVLRKTNIPSAKYSTFESLDQKKFSELVLSLGGYPIVLKQDGLARGKGVHICYTEEQAHVFLKECLSRPTKKGGKPLVVVEEMLQGHEVSLFAITDGHAYALLEPVCDYKRLLEGNKGPNTGGMGAYSPVPWFSYKQAQEIGLKIFPPVLKYQRDMQAPFKGLLYAGLMVQQNQFWVLEFNSRFGDPETQALLPRLETDLLPLLVVTSQGKLENFLDEHPLCWSKKTCVNIVAASRGYPEEPAVGFEITKCAETPFGVIEKAWQDYVLYFAGVRGEADKIQGKLFTSGGRVLSVSTLGESLEKVQNQALQILEKIRFDGIHFRKDIGKILLDY